MTRSVYVFDAYGTLFDVHDAIGRYRAEIGDHADKLSEAWRIKQLEYTWTGSLIGQFRDFRELTASALDTAAAGFWGLPNDLRSKLLAAYEELNAYEDVVPTLTALKTKGAQTAILSNGSTSMLANATRAANLTGLLDAVISVDAVRVYKPKAEAYTLVAAHFASAPSDVFFQSSNRWDIAGAKAFGFHTTWVNRAGKPDEYLDLPPDRVVTSLEALLR